MKSLVFCALLGWLSILYWPSMAQTKYISLPQAKTDLEYLNFYIDTVVDSRTDTTTIGTALLGIDNHKSNLNINTGAATAINNYYKKYLIRLTNQFPISIVIENLEISEASGTGKEFGTCNISLGFYKDKKYIGSKDKKKEYWDGFGVTSLHGRYISQALNECISDVMKGKITLDASRDKTGLLTKTINPIAVPVIQEKFLVTLDKDTINNEIDSTYIVQFKKSGIHKLYTCNGTILRTSKVSNFFNKVPEAEHQYSLAVTKFTTAKIAIICSGAGMATFIGNAIFFHYFNTAALTVGVAGLGVAIPFYVSANKSLRKAVQIFNKGAKLTYWDNHDLKIGLTNNGFTFGLTF